MAHHPILFYLFSQPSSIVGFVTSNEQKLKQTGPGRDEREIFNIGSCLIKFGVLGAKEAKR